MFGLCEHYTTYQSVVLLYCLVSDDDEIDYSVKPEFYDSDLDGKDELWVQKKRKGHHTDAVLSCPCCFTTLCLECQMYVPPWISLSVQFVVLLCTVLSRTILHGVPILFCGYYNMDAQIFAFIFIFLFCK